ACAHRLESFLLSVPLWACHRSRQGLSKRAQCQLHTSLVPTCFGSARARWSSDHASPAASTGAFMLVPAGRMAPGGLASLKTSLLTGGFFFSGRSSQEQ